VPQGVGGSSPLLGTKSTDKDQRMLVFTIFKPNIVLILNLWSNRFRVDIPDTD
jgi:hypothetical protein